MLAAIVFINVTNALAITFRASFIFNKQQQLNSREGGVKKKSYLFNSPQKAYKTNLKVLLIGSAVVFYSFTESITALLQLLYTLIALYCSAKVGNTYFKYVTKL